MNQNILQNHCSRVDLLAEPTMSANLFGSAFKRRSAICRACISAILALMLTACGGGGGGGEPELDVDVDLTAKYVGTWKSDCHGIDINSISALENGVAQKLVYVIETLELVRVSTSELRGKRKIDVYGGRGEISGQVLCLPENLKGSILWNDDEREEFTMAEGVARSGAGLRIWINSQRDLIGGEKVDDVMVSLDNLTPEDREYSFGTVWFTPWHIASMWNPVDIAYVNNDKITFGRVLNISYENPKPTDLRLKAGFTRQ